MFVLRRSMQAQALSKFLHVAKGLLAYFHWHEAKTGPTVPLIPVYLLHLLQIILEQVCVQLQSKVCDTYYRLPASSKLQA